MTKRSFVCWSIFLIALLGHPAFINSSQLNCDQEDAPLECLLLKEYTQINNELACQLCALAIESKKYPSEADKFCNNPQGEIRSCGMISFTYLLVSSEFQTAFDLEYEIFYRDPFKHDQKVSSILEKQNVRKALLSWLQNNIENKRQEANLQRAIVNLYIDDIEQTQKQLQQYLSMNSGVYDKRTIKLQCRISQKQGQFNHGFNILSKYIQEGQKDQRNYQMLEPYLYHLKANFLMHHLKFKEAIEEFKKASNTFKSHYREVAFIGGFKFSQYNIGLCYQKMSKHQEAINKYMELVKREVKNVEVLNALGNSFVEVALQSDGQNPDEQKMRKAIFYLTRAIEDDPQYFLAHYNLGYAYLKQKEYDQAIEKFHDSLKIKNTTQAHYGLLSAYFLSGKNQAAEKLIAQIMTVDKDSIDDLLSVCYEYGNLSQNSKFYYRVIAELEHMIKSANGHYWKAMIEFERQQYGLAIDHFLQAYNKGYQEPHLLFNLGYCYELVSNFKQALIYYQKAYSKNPRPETKAKIQECRRKLSQTAKLLQL